MRPRSVPPSAGWRTARHGGRGGTIDAVRLIDPHAHLNADRFAHDVELVIGAARLAGIERLLIPGWNVASSERALQLAERWPWLDASVGIHPHDAAKVDDAGWSRIEQWASDERVSAIGETGLDSDRMFSPWDAQLDNLRRNLALAKATGKPAILHCRSKDGRRDAQDALVEEVDRAGRPPAVIHSFSGPVDYARAMLDRGLAISFSGLVFRSGEEASADVAPLVPAERLLVETDSPFLTPPGGPKGRNDPSAVAITAAWVAERRGEAPEALGERLIDAYDRTFPRARPR